ncbi:hypothetical protein NQZ68_000872 [Dissostichus eleginoides]|nr:hypothetical protein NQZ68_000872 [Dissostichus eleginoides]
MPRLGAAYVWANESWGQVAKRSPPWTVSLMSISPSPANRIRGRRVSGAAGGAWANAERAPPCPSAPDGPPNPSPGIMNMNHYFTRVWTVGMDCL